MSKQAPDSSAASQSQRRATYGLNVTVAIVAALGLVILVNAIAAIYLKQFSPLDLTATGAYGLAPQTRKVLGDLKHDYRIVTIFRSGDPDTAPYIRQAGDLIDLYARQSSHIQVEHINPDLEAGRLEQFLGVIADRYKTALQPTRTAIEGSLTVLNTVSKKAAEHRDLINALLQGNTVPEGKLHEELVNALQAFGRMSSDIDKQDQDLHRRLDETLPAYSSIRDALEQYLTQLDDKVYAVLIRQFEQAVRQDKVPDSVKEQLLKMNAQFGDLRKQVEQSIADLRAAAQDNTRPVREYDDVRDSINSSSNPVVVVGPHDVKVIGLESMFRLGAVNKAKPGEQPNVLFLGEDKLTGTLVSMMLTQPPLVVLVSTGQQPALGPNGQYNTVAGRLRNMNFDVRSWSPTGQMGPMGQPQPAGPPPEPQPGQKAVWILLPTMPSRNPMDMGGGPGVQQAAELLQKRLQDGDGVMLMLSVSPSAGFGAAAPDPAAQIASSWGITPQLDRVILRQFTNPDGSTYPSNQFTLTTWPTALPITKALEGIRGLFLNASPLTLAAKPPAGTQVWPLARITGSDLWAQTDLSAQNPKLDPKTAAPSFTVAAAAERDHARLVVVADPLWATDTVTNYGVLGPGTAQNFGAAFPGNTEFFVNSVNWLAHLDQLIAASARVQDIRRIGALSRTAQQGIYWGLLAGLPLLALVAGLGVWLVRRQG